MALHDYRRMIDVHGGGMIAVEIDPQNLIEFTFVTPENNGFKFMIDAPTAGVLYDAIAGAIKTIESIVPPSYAFPIYDSPEAARRASDGRIEEAGE